MSNSCYLSCFTIFSNDISQYPLPTKFTYPFHYQPHPLALVASAELQQKLAAFHPVDSAQQGMIYGVLIVKDAQGALGYLAAASSNNTERCTNQHNGSDTATINFVPPIHREDDISEFVKKQQLEITDISKKITQLLANPEMSKLTALRTLKETNSEQELQCLQQEIRNNKKTRKEKRAWLSAENLTDHEHSKVSISLSRASSLDKKSLQALKLLHQKSISLTSRKLEQLTDEIALLKKIRKNRTSKLKKHFFKQYKMLNKKGERKDLTEIFAETIVQKPPTGSGDCAAPKLLQYAFEHKLTPLCMAEFWWGRQPQAIIRKHQHFYPACQSKCQPILSHMLAGMAVDENPLLQNPAEGKELTIVFQDEHVVVVNKPAGLLSVPGKSIKDSVYTRINTKLIKFFPTQRELKGLEARH